MRKLHPVWWLNGALVAACAALLATVVGDTWPVEQVLPWWLIALAVAVTERWPVHFEFRRSAHSFSLTDLPVALALLFLPGPVGVCAVVLGTVPALVLRRLPLIKFVFNLGQFALATCIGYVATLAIAGPAPAFGPALWIGVGVGLQLGGLVTIALIGSVIFITERSLTREQVRQMFGMDALVTATNTSLALVLAVIIVREPVAAPILGVPIGIAFFAYGSYVRERQRHEKLEFLYEANRSLTQSSEIADAIEGLLERALEAYRAEHAEVILFAGDGGAPLRTSRIVGGPRETMTVARHGDADALRRMVERAGGPVALQPPFHADVHDYLEERGVRHAMVAELRGEERVVGVLLLANRFGVGRAFTADDLALFETLAANASAALQFDRLEQAVSDLRALQDQLQHQAYHDPLTGLANRALFGKEVRAALADAGPEGGVATLFIDLDDFKTVNDTLGHAVGDELLTAVAARLTNCVREGDLVARLGGDEFAILLRRRVRAEQAGVEIAERVLAAFAQPVAVAGEAMSVSLSVGVATSEHSGADAEDLLRDADVAMYEAKEAGKRRVAVFDPVMREVLLKRHGLREELERAIADGSLVVHYQPIVDLTSGATAAMEALVRWDHPDRGRIPPAEFIPLAEETGLIVALGRLVLEVACRDAARWHEMAGDAAPKVQVNLSALELETDDVVDRVAAAVAAAGIDPGRLVLEITETLLMQDAQRAVARLTALRELGVRLALDDFGTGYSSLSYLRSLPLDMVKIAKPFVDALAVDARDEAFVRLMVDLAANIGLSVVAEGIENAEQLRVLRELGCDLGQGYVFAPAVADVTPWLLAPAHGRT